MAEPIPEASPVPASGSRAGPWVVGVFAFVALTGASIVSVGLASIVWVPLLLGLGIAMVTIWSARRRRQTTQGRNSNEIKDPAHAHPSWPTKGVIDDRLPEP